MRCSWVIFASDESMESREVKEPFGMELRKGNLNDGGVFANGNPSNSVRMSLEKISVGPDHLTGIKNLSNK